MSENIYKEYLRVIRDAMRRGVKENRTIDYTINFCEDNDLCEEYVLCKLRPDAFYGWARYKTGEITLDTFEKKIISILNQQSRR